MTKPIVDFTKLSRLVHEPARLVILTALSECASADFTFLRRTIGLTPGNLNTHLTALSNGGLVSIEKRIHGKGVQTLVSLTTAGRKAVKGHWRQLEALRKQTTSRERLAIQRPAPATAT